ncbi:hypothetical protein [Methylomonas rosea]|uniref:Uncharacterized protein n=1 Tax=Methylomonas rosea TaxID=2952227 RepID=A0ABT1TW29_9GAMM|nr:hypothetical protein [Methylomonas sp. WSC-7]MCQ8118976.1 hypothetical protein [Methylomonas sp. WSC-7]
MNRKAQFAHFLKHKIGEYRFRLSEVLEVSDRSLNTFNSKLPQNNSDGRLLTYAFSAMTSQVQTIKDIVPVLLDREVPWSEYKNVRHMDFVAGARNAITHDGNPIIDLWVDGKYYVASPFLRIGARGETITVVPPTEDLATVSLEFTHDFSAKLLELVEGTANDPSILKPIYGREYFEEAMRHPAIPEFARDLYAESDKTEHDKNDPSRLEILLSDLNGLISYSLGGLAGKQPDRSQS